MYSRFLITDARSAAVMLAFLAAALPYPAECETPPPASRASIAAPFGSENPKGREETVLKLPTGRMYMIHDWDKGIWISKNCVQKNGGYRCQAVSALHEVEAGMKEFPTLLDYGPELGSLLCEGPLKALYHTAYLENRSQISVCRFKDGSIINTGALTDAAEARSKAKSEAAKSGAKPKKRQKR